MDRGQKNNGASQLDWKPENLAGKLTQIAAVPGLTKKSNSGLLHL
jgi:hypothetical protein